MGQPFQNTLRTDANRCCLLSLLRSRRRLVLFFTACALIVASVILLKTPVSLSLSQLSFAQPKNFLDGCRHVYIDMGTNIGVQIRKLYEPHLYKGAYVLPLFREIFANETSEVCSVGFEANPVHDKYLQEYEAYCAKRGWRVKVFTSTAIGTKDGNVTFYTDPTDNANNQWGASLVTSGHKSNVTVRSIDIASWMRQYVFTRFVPAGSTPPRIMMKSDIEGHDPNVLADMILKGVYCSIDLIYAEHLKKAFRGGVSQLQSFSPSCKTKLVYIDDETYHRSRFPFTFPNSTQPN